MNDSSLVCQARTAVFAADRKDSSGISYAPDAESFRQAIGYDGFGWEDWGGLHLTLFTTVVGISAGMPLGILLAVRLIPSDILAEHRASASELNRRPASRTAAIVVGPTCFFSNPSHALKSKAQAEDGASTKQIINTQNFSKKMLFMDFFKSFNCILKFTRYNDMNNSPRANGNLMHRNCSLFSPFRQSSLTIF